MIHISLRQLEYFAAAVEHRGAARAAQVLGVSQPSTHRYLAEAQYRFNRRFNLRSILARLVRAACLTTPTPNFAIRVAEVGR